MDTIGKLWAHGFLDGGRHSPERLRDAGRRYATLYWYRLGPCCASTAHYGEFIRGTNTLHIADPSRDFALTNLLARRTLALQSLGHNFKASVDMMCVDGQGDNDPNWLTEIVMGFPNEAARQRSAVEMAMCRIELVMPDVPHRLKRELRDARKRLKAAQREARVRIVPQLRLTWLRAGLDELADIDAMEGRHDRQRQRKTRGGGWDALAEGGDDDARC